MTDPKPQIVKIFLVAYDQHEERIARAYLKEKYPEAFKSGQVVRELPLLKLSPQYAIVTLTRGDDRTETSKTKYNFQDGRKEGIEATPLPILIKEVRESEPVYVKDHWEATAAGDIFGIGAFTGDVRRSSFIQAVGIAGSPWVARTEPGTPDTLRLIAV